MGRSADVEVVRQWRDRVGRWRRSGLSIVEFCRREGISQASFFAWRKRLAGEDAARGRGGPRVKETNGAGRFVQLSPSAWSQSSGVQIRLPSGAVVALPVDASAELVTAAICAAAAMPAETRPC